MIDNNIEKTGLALKNITQKVDRWKYKKNLSSSKHQKT